MFGIFYALACGIGYVVSGAKMGIEDAISRQQAEEKERNEKIKTNTYMDHRGATRDITTNQRVIISKDFLGNGDTYIYDDKLNPIRNLSQEKRDLEYTEARAKRKPGETVMFYMWEHEAKDHGGYKTIFDNGFVRGDRYKDLDNGKIYVEKSIHSNYLYSNMRLPYDLEWEFYIDVATKKIVRETDRCSSLRKKLMEQGAYYVDDERMDAIISALNNHLGYNGWNDRCNTYMSVSKYKDGSIRFSWEDN